MSSSQLYSQKSLASSLELAIDDEKDTESTANDSLAKEILKSKADIMLQDLKDRYTEIEMKNEKLPLKDKIETNSKINTETYNEASKLNGKRLKHLWIQYNQASGGYGSGGEYSEPIHYDPKTRNGFIKIVFIILFMMLIVTAGYIFLVFMIPELKAFYQSAQIWFGLAAAAVLLVLNYAMICLPQTRVAPCSYICLCIAVIGMSNLVVVITIKYQTHILWYAFIATSVAVFVCILLASTSFDFTKFYIYIIAIFVVVVTISTTLSVTMLILKIRYKPLTLGLLFAGAIVNVAFLIVELQTILGGRAVELAENEHAFGAYLLYISIVDLFIKIVQIIGTMEE